MWDRFTSEARAAIESAAQEAGRLGLNVVSTEHLLLGIIKEDRFVAARILAEMGIKVSAVRYGVGKWLDRGSGRLGSEMTFAPRTERVLGLAIDEADRQSRDAAGTGHLLAAVVREGEGIAAGVLDELGVALDPVRSAAGRLERDELEREAEN